MRCDGQQQGRLRASLRGPRVLERTCWTWDWLCLWLASLIEAHHETGQPRWGLLTLWSCSTPLVRTTLLQNPGGPRSMTFLYTRMPWPHPACFLRFPWARPSWRHLALLNTVLGSAKHSSLSLLPSDLTTTSQAHFTIRLWPLALSLLLIGFSYIGLIYTHQALINCSKILFLNFAAPF